MEDVRTQPSAAALIESMRDIGYTFESALADIIDNAITARASQLDIRLEGATAEPSISVLDNGLGMSREQLLQAMRPGSQNPLASRGHHDLGRFGLGMKTASFSQCRKLTVISRKNGVTSGACWDLDYVAANDEWLLRVLSEEELHHLPPHLLPGESGTVVLWENLDRLRESTGKTALKDHLYERIEHAEKHLSLVFHRFLSGEPPFPRITININGGSISPFDPFNSRHAATTHLREEEILLEGQSIRVQPFVLPHHKKTTAADWEKYGGDAGYLKNQGFYVYRAGRLIIHGTWFRLAKQSELTKLARVRIDMPNGLDHLWKIDVKKASAQPPLVVRERLKRIIDEISGASNRVYTSRGRRISDPHVVSLWNRRIDKNEIHYEINRDHPSIAGILGSLDDQHRKQMSSLLKAVEQNFPIDALFSDASSQPESLSTNGMDDESLRGLIEMSYRLLKSKGLETDEIQTSLQSTEPYRSCWEQVEPLLKKLQQEAENEPN